MTALGFARWVSDVPTGGNVYDDELAAGLRRASVDVTEHRVTGAWPDAGAAARDRLAAVLHTRGHWLVDGIVACGAPKAVAEALAAGQRITLLAHMCLPDERGLTRGQRQRYAAAEAETLALPVGVLCTSRWTAGELARRYGRADAGVALPGSWPAPLSRGSPGGPPRLLTVASLTPTKDQLTLVRALAALRELPWTARLVGADRVDPRYAGQVREAIGRTGLAQRVALTGPLRGAELAAEWDRADLLVLPSPVEAYGLVVVEALARGIASVVVAGTGAVEAQRAGATPGGDPAGTAVPPEDSAALAVTLRRWLTDPELRHSWREAARQRRPGLPTWDDTARAARGYLAQRWH
jgi:glycosyltransferase involved in cell wall biosynthesis